MTAKDILEKHFNCQICQDQLNNPRRLACGHVYCHECLDELLRRTTDYYWIRRGTVPVFGFKCPECRKINRIPRPEEPPERWVHQIKIDFKLDGILADLKELVLQNELKERETKDQLRLLEEIEIQTTTKTSAVQRNFSNDSTLALAAIADVMEHETASEQVKEVIDEDEKEISSKKEVTDKVESLMLDEYMAFLTMLEGSERFENEKSQGVDVFSMPEEAFQEDDKGEKKEKQIWTHTPDYYQILETVDQVNLKHDPLVSPPITADYMHRQASVNTKGNSLKIEVPDKVVAHGVSESTMLVQNGASLTIATGLGLKEKRFENEKSRGSDFSFTPEEAFQCNRTEKNLDWDQDCP